MNLSIINLKSLYRLHVRINRQNEQLKCEKRGNLYCLILRIKKKEILKKRTQYLDAFFVLSLFDVLISTVSSSTTSLD